MQRIPGPIRQECDGFYVCTRTNEFEGTHIKGKIKGAYEEIVPFIMLV
jgi:hypothetical protein